MNKRDIKAIRKLLVDNINLVHRSASKNAKLFDRQTIPFNLWRKIIDTAKIDFSSEVPEAVNKLAKSMNDTFELMYEKGVEFAKENESTQVPVAFIKQMCVETISAFDEGLNGG